MTTTIVPLFLFFFIFPQPAYAYLDPGTGSYIFQLLIATLFGALFAIKLYWKRIRGFFANLSPKKKKAEKSND